VELISVPVRSPFKNTAEMILFVHVSQIISLLLCSVFSVLPCFASEERIPELDSPTVTEKPLVDSQPSELIERDRKERQVIIYVDAGRKSYSEGEYSTALKLALAANKVQKSGSADALIAECLAHTARKVEAIAALGKDPSWETQVSVFQTLGMNKEVLEACDSAVEFYPKAVVTKCKLLMKDGNFEESTRFAYAQYFNYKSENYLPPEMVAFFKDYNLPLPKSAIEEKSQKEVIRLISMLANMPAPKAADLDKILGKTFGRHFNSLSNQYSEYRSDRDLTSPVCRMMFLDRDSSHNGTRELWITINYGSTNLKSSEIVALLLDAGTPKKYQTEPMGTCIVHYFPDDVLEFTLPDGRLEFYLVGDDKHLVRIKRIWSCEPYPVKVVENSQPTEHISTIEEIQKEITDCNYRKATKDLLFRCINSPADKDKCEQMRSLLAKCFDLLKRPEAADYVRVAPWNNLCMTIHYVNFNHAPESFDMTLFRYMHRLWKVHGVAHKDKGWYMFEVPGGGNFTLDSAAQPTYDAVFKIVGPLENGMQAVREIPPLPASLTDEIQYRWNGTATATEPATGHK
jgi:hypothetical protein